ncbi:hypothetical protein V8C37DRAFT_405356 [Trichoderma ceciliae]
MPTLTFEQLVHLQELCQKYRIEFLGEIDSSNWPEWHEDTLNGVRDVASMRYDAYATNPAHLGTDPWKMERKSHAMVLVKSADRSRGRNESTWRHAFGAAKTLLVVTVGNEYGKLVNLVVVRERDGLWISKLEAVGLNQIFNFRADEEVRHGPEIRKELGKRECPDRVYGLRKTRNIELLLYDIAAQRPDPEVSTDPGQRGRPFALRFMNQPMNAKGDRQLFPFLVLEAKTGSSDEWHAINMQTAFSIRTFLDSQQQLYSAASALSDWKARPMVWFFSNKGENWRLCAAYTEDAPAERDRVAVIDVWHGCITSRDGALQLLLLVDYLFDWARDKYREDIIGALRTVARGESDAASGVYPDTDIFSTVPLDKIHQPTQVTEDDSHLSSYISAQSPFLALDSPAGVFRHATFVESRYYCLYITRDNVKTFLQSATQTRVQPLCRLVLGHMSQSILTDPGTLDAMEEEWTGVSRSSASSYRPQAQEQFHVVMSFTTYLSTQWHQVRELSVIAITGDAWKFIGDASGFKIKLRQPFLYHYQAKSEFIRMIMKLKAGSARQILHAAITRTTYRIVRFAGSHSLRIEVDSGSLRDIVYFIYAWLKRGGALEPDESFLRSSKLFHQQHLREDQAEPFPLIQENHLQASDEGCVLITATCEGKDSAGRQGAKLCAYLTEGSPVATDIEDLAAILKKAIETRDVYHTTRTSTRALGEQDICMACQVFLADENQYEWFKNAVRGEPPLPIKNLSEEEVKTRFRTMRDGYPTLREDITPRPHGFSNYDGNIDWAKKLDFYSKLDDPFNDIAELAAQWQQFCRYCDENHPHRSFNRAANLKRKRSEGPDSEETDNSPRDLEEPDENVSAEVIFNGDVSNKDMTNAT